MQNTFVRSNTQSIKIKNNETKKTMKTNLLILKKKNLISVYTLLITLFISYQANAQDFSLETKKVASDRAIFDKFGYGIAIDGDYAIVAAINYDDDTTPVNNIGGVYFYKKDGNGVWQETQVLTTSDYHQNDYASRVSISGDYAVLGVPSNDYDENDANLLAGAGAVYIFERDGSGTWTEIKKIVASDRAAGDSFGISVSMSGYSLLVGASGHDPYNSSGSTTLSNAGAAYMINRGTSNTEWLETQKIVSNDRAENDSFGASVAVYGLSTGLNNTVVIGAFREDENIVGSTTRTDAGSAYIFSPTSNWTQTQKITASDRNNDDRFGYSVAIYQNTIVVGAIHEDQPATGSGNLLDSGSAYIFEKSGTWSQTQKITASNRAAENKFGNRVAVYNDLILVGTNVPATEEGQAYLFQKATTWSQIENFTASDGVVNNAYSSAIAINDGSIFIGATGESFNAEGTNEMGSAGAIYIYQDVTTASVHESELKNITVYPQPTTGILNIIGVDVEKIQLYDVSGRLLETISDSKIDISNHAAGFYILKVTNEQGNTFAKRVIKQ